MSKLRIVLLSTVCLELSACTQYMNRYVERIDTINFNSGDAVATNEALMVPTPWPRYAYDTNIAFDGERIARAVERYRAGEKQPIETIPQRKVTFGSKFTDANAGAGPAAPPTGYAAPIATEKGAGIAPPPPSSDAGTNYDAAPPY